MANVYVRSGASGSGTGADWANAYTTLSAALAAKAAGDNFWVSEDHNESLASGGMTCTCPGTRSNPCTIIAVNHSGSVPPASADVQTTPIATIATVDGSISIRGSFLSSGIAWIAGTSTSSARNLNIADNTTSPEQKFKDSSFKLASTGASNLNMGTSGGGSKTVDWDNVTYQVGNTGSTIAWGGAVAFRWRNTPSAIVGATLPTTLLDGSTLGAPVLIEGVDLSALGSGKTLVSALATNVDVYLKDDKYGSSVAVAATPTVHGANVYSLRSDTTGNYRNEKYNYQGTQLTETTIVRTGGATDGATAVSWNLSTTANCKWIFPFEAMVCSENNTVTASNVTVTMYGVYNAAALPNNDDIWFDAEYLGSSASPVGSFASGSKANFCASGSAQTADTSAWDSLVSARQNSHAYSSGQVYKSANNAGRIFFCTGAGTSASSEPAGVASAVDGGLVNDGSATFRAGMRWKQSITLSSPQPGQAGVLYCYPKVGKASIPSGSVYFDPHPVLS
jgi:hypothetical protein